MANMVIEMVGDEFIRRPMDELLQLEPGPGQLSSEGQLEEKELMKRLVERFSRAQEPNFPRMVSRYRHDPHVSQESKVR